MRWFVVGLVLLASACGGGGKSVAASGSDAPPSHAVTVHAKDTLRFDRTTYDALAGDVAITYVNDGTLAHSLTIDGKSTFKLAVDSTRRQEIGTVSLQPGTYTIACDMPGHRAAGMVATLIVPAS